MKIIISEIIKEQRRRLGVSQEALADQFGVSIQAVSKWEHGLSCPDITLLPAIAEYFGVTIDYLLTGRTIVNKEETSENGEAEASPAAVYTVAGDTEITEKCPLPDMLYLVQVYNGHIISSTDDFDEMIDLQIPNGVYNISLHAPASLGDIRGNIAICEGGQVGINGNIKGNVTVNGNSEVGFNADIYGDVSLLNGEFHANNITGDVSVNGGNLNIQGDIDGDASASHGSINITGDINGDASFTDGNLATSGDVNGDVTVTNGNFVSDGEVNGDLSIEDGNITVNGNLTVEGDVDGNINIEGGDLTVEGDIDGDVTVNAGDINCEGDISGEVSIIDGNVTADTIEDNIYVKNGNVNAEVIEGDVEVTGGNVTAEDISGEVSVRGGKVICDDLDDLDDDLDDLDDLDDELDDIDNEFTELKMPIVPELPPMPELKIPEIPEIPPIPEFKIPDFASPVVIEEKMKEVENKMKEVEKTIHHIQNYNINHETVINNKLSSLHNYNNGYYKVVLDNSIFIPSEYTHRVEFPNEKISIWLEMDYDNSKAKISMFGENSYSLAIERPINDISGERLSFVKSDNSTEFFHTGGVDCVFTIGW